jgi:hypothetical protein
MGQGLFLSSRKLIGSSQKLKTVPGVRICQALLAKAWGVCLGLQHGIYD